MTPEQRRRVRDLFEAALDKDTGEARGWIAAEAPDDPAVREEVLSLLDHHSRAGGFLVDPVADRLPHMLNDDEPLAPGTVVGTYTIVRELGRGGMGRVYLASDTRLGRMVALKALAPHLLSDARQRERLRREARAAAALTHPGICTVYALEEIDGELYIASEYVEGRTLREEIASASRPPAADLIERTARELAIALSSAHARGVIHRDLKPENVMRTVDGRVKVLDFGLARIEVPDDAPSTFATQAGVMLGTPAYMAPEQITGQRVDARADVFAFGVLIYEYASGVHPFEAANALATVARVIESDVAPLTSRTIEVGSALAQVIARCLKKSPADRYASAAELVEALSGARDQLPPASAHATWWRLHQLIVCFLYVAGAALSWQIKDWLETPITVAVFIALGAASTIGCVLRGHLVFTERVNRANLAVERRRTTRATRLLDALVAVLLAWDGILIAPTGALPAVFALSLGLGIALAAVVLEPATTAAAFGDGT